MSLAIRSTSTIWIIRDQAGFSGYARDVIRGGTNNLGGAVGDQGRWFKLWVSAPDDPDLDSLPISDYGRWAKFGAYLKEHGTAGRVSIKEPARILQAKFQVSSFQEVLDAIRRFPNCLVSNETHSPVSFLIEWKNWHKYQGDYSTDRVRSWRKKNRQSVTPKEEKRREEKKHPLQSPVATPVTGSNSFEEFWQAYPIKKGKLAARKVWNRAAKGEGFLLRILTAIANQRNSPDWQKEQGRFIPHPATWLNQGRWEDEVADAREEPYGYER